MKTELKWGLIFSLAGLLWPTLEFFAGLHDKYLPWHPYLTNLFAFPAIVLMAAAVQEKRRLLGGRISFKQAFLCGLGVSVVVALLSPLTQYLFHRFINPNFFANLIRYTVANGKATLEQAQAYFNLPSYMLQASLGALVMGLLTSLILAMIMRTKSSTAAA